MSDALSAPLPDLSDLSRADWDAAVQSLAEQNGDYIVLDDEHVIMQVGSGDRLLVTFEEAHDIRSNQADGIPLGIKFARSLDVAAMVVLCKAPTWFRSEAVYDFFDALTDEGVFDSFEHVAFFGIGLGGYGAAAFSVAAPGSDVVVINPQATLDPRMTEWDPRFISARRKSFTDRYGFAPHMVESARHTMVLYDPESDVDAMHSALFERPGVTRFRCQHLGSDLFEALERMEICDALIQDALTEQLDVTRFAKLYRERRSYNPYLRTFEAYLEDQGRHVLAEWMCKSVLARKHVMRLQAALQRLEERAAQEKAEQAAPPDEAANDAAE